MSGERLHAQAKAMKEQLVERMGVQDLMPVVIALTDDNESYLGQCTPDMEAALGSGTRMGDILASSVTSLRRDHGDVGLKRLMLVVEGYAREFTPDREGDARHVEHGDLGRDFAENPSSDVTEVLMTNIWNYQNGEVVMEMWTSKFHYTDHGVIVWDTTDQTDNGEGDIADAGRRVMRDE